MVEQLPRLWGGREYLAVRDFRHGWSLYPGAIKAYDRLVKLGLNVLTKNDILYRHPIRPGFLRGRFLSGGTS